MQADQKAGQQRGERQLHHHDAVDRRGREHDNRAQRGLDETEADNTKPSQGLHRVLGFDGLHGFHGLSPIM
jgi:hypothetical protein